MHLLKKLSFAILFGLGLSNTACKKNEEQSIPQHYAPGIMQVSETGATDCTLGRCDDNRKVILNAENAEGTVVNRIDAVTQEERYYIHVEIPGAIDGFLNGDCCNFTDQLKLLDGKKVQFSGEYREGCGQLVPMIGGEEIYFLKLTQLKER